MVDRKLNRLLIEGVNFVNDISMVVKEQRKRHVRGTDSQAGGIYDVESFIPYSNVQLVDPSTKQFLEKNNEMQKTNQSEDKQNR